MSGFQVDQVGGGERGGVLDMWGWGGAEEGKGLYYKASFHSPGSFKVAFLEAAKKMQKVIMELKGGKRGSSSFPHGPAHTRLENS